VTKKWLNVVLDLNGILCTTTDLKSKGYYSQIGEASQAHSATAPAVVGTKEVYVRPNCSQFLSELAKIAYVSVWSSMAMHNTERVVKHLFAGLDWPLLVLAQDSCTTLKCRDGSGKITTFKEPGTHKDLFLKNLSTLLKDSRGNFTLENTILVDDSPSKHIMNKSENVILPDTWTNRGNGPKDAFLMDVLLPWLKKLHSARDKGLKSFRGSSSAKIGRRMLCDERNKREYNKLMDVVRVSSSLR
jgi:hypothetical protein